MFLDVLNYLWEISSNAPLYISLYMAKVLGIKSLEQRRKNAPLWYIYCSDAHIIIYTCLILIWITVCNMLIFMKNKLKLDLK
jgi:hypothetical protein